MANKIISYTKRESFIKLIKTSKGQIKYEDDFNEDKVILLKKNTDVYN